MALNPDLLKRRRRLLTPRAPEKGGYRAQIQQIPVVPQVLGQQIPAFPGPKGGELPEEVTIGRTFRQAVPFSTAVVLSMRCPLNGRIVELNPHFPPGCNALVGMRFGTDKHGQCFPDTGFLALDDASPVFSVSISVEYDERLWLEIWNQDAINPHTPSLSLTIRGT